MIECNDNMEFNNVEEDYNNNIIDEEDFTTENENNNPISNISIHDSNPTNKSKVSQVSLSMNTDIEQFDKLTDKIFKLNKSGPINISKIKENKFIPISRNSNEKKSLSVISSHSKTARIDKLLEDHEENDNFNICDVVNPNSKKGKHDKQTILPFCVNTIHSVNLCNPKISQYYSEKNRNPSSQSNNTIVTNSINNETSIDVKDVESLRSMICIFLQLDEHCATLSEQVKTYRDEKKQYEDYILNIMEKCNKERIPHHDKILRREVKEFRPKPKEEDILQTLITIFNDETVANQVVKAINESVPLDEKIALKQDKVDKPIKFNNKIKK